MPLMFQISIRNVIIETYYWPSSWRENTTAPKLSAGQDCSWTVTVPKGYFAKLIIDGKVADNDSRFQIIDSAGNLIQSTHEKKDPYYFPPAKFTLVASNEAVATFAFKIVWALIPTQPSVNEGVGSMPHLENATNAIFNNLYGTTNQLSVLVFPQDIHNSLHLRSVLLFETDGHSDPTYVTNLHSVFKTGQQYISSGSEINLVNLEVSNTTDYVLVQQYDSVKNFHPYKALECNMNTNCTVTLDGGKKSSALVTAPHGVDNLVDIQMDPAANISIYYGALNNFGFVATFNGTEILKNLPVDAHWVMQYVISSGKAVMTFGW